MNQTVKGVLNLKLVSAVAIFVPLFALRLLCGFLMVACGGLASSTQCPQERSFGEELGEAPRIQIDRMTRPLPLLNRYWMGWRSTGCGERADQDGQATQER